MVAPAAAGSQTRSRRSVPAAWTRPFEGPLATRLLVVFCYASIAYLFVQILMYRYGRDQGIYAMVADAMLRGGMPYRDAWDFKPPGIYLIYAFSRALFGSAQWGIRAVEVAALVSLVGAFRILARRFFGDARIGVLGAALAVLTYAQLEFWHTAQPESFGASVVAWAMVLATYEGDEGNRRDGRPDGDRHRDPRGGRRRLAAWASAGALYAFAGLLKPPLAGCALVSAAFASYRNRVRGDRSFRSLITPFLAMGAGGVAVVAACALWFVARGAWHDLYETLFVFTPHYTALSWDGATLIGMLYLAIEEWLTSFSSGNAAGMLAAVTFGTISDREHEGIAHVVGVVFVQLVGVALQGKFFPYHFGAAFPLAGFLAGLGAFKLWQRATGRGALGIAAFAAATAVVLQARSATRDTSTDYWDRCLVRQEQLFSPGASAAAEAADAQLYSVADVNYGADVEVARFLDAHTSPGAPVFVWGFEPMIYDVARRAPATRYLYDVPQRVAWGQADARRNLMQDLAAHPPAAIVVEHRDVFPAVTGNAIDSADELKTFPELARLIDERFAFARRIEDFDIYLLRR